MTEENELIEIILFFIPSCRIQNDTLQISGNSITNRLTAERIWRF